MAFNVLCWRRSYVHICRHRCIQEWRYITQLSANITTKKKSVKIGSQVSLSWLPLASILTKLVELGVKNQTPPPPPPAKKVLSVFNRTARMLNIVESFLCCPCMQITPKVCSLRLLRKGYQLLAQIYTVSGGSHIALWEVTLLVHAKYERVWKSSPPIRTR